MSLTPWKPKQNWVDPFQDFNEWSKEVDSIFNHPLLSHRKGSGAFPWNPAVDIFDEEDQLRIKADLPGITKEQIEITCDDGVLTIKGEKSEEKESKEKDCVRSERFLGTFQRSFTLPAGLDSSRVNASYKNGVLEIVIPKKEDAKANKIKVDIS